MKFYSRNAKLVRIAATVVAALIVVLHLLNTGADGLVLAIAPLIAAAGISTIGSLLGGALASRSAQNQQEDNIQMQKEFAQNGVRWRVEDAQKAGVHPLFALGASTQGFAPNPVIPDDFGISQAGQGIGNAVAASAQNGDREMLKMQMSAMRSATLKDEAEAMYWQAQTAKLMHEMNNSAPFPELITDQNTYKGTVNDQQQVYNPYSDAIVRRMSPTQMDIEGVEPVAIGTNSGSVENAGRGHQMWTEWKTTNGPVVLPRIGNDTNLMESLEGLDVKIWPVIIAENRRQYGDAGVKRLMQLYNPGKNPVSEFTKKYGERPYGGYGEPELQPFMH